MEEEVDTQRGDSHASLFLIGNKGEGKRGT